EVPLTASFAAAPVSSYVVPSPAPSGAFQLSSAPLFLALAVNPVGDPGATHGLVPALGSDSTSPPCQCATTTNVYSFAQFPPVNSNLNGPFASTDCGTALPSPEVLSV